MKNFKNVSLSQKTLKTGVGVGKLFVFFLEPQLHLKTNGFRFD
jgi:hypothetical protein